MSKYKIIITQLFPDLLNLYGDKGNIEALRKRLDWRGIEAEVIYHKDSCGDIDLKGTDILFLGGGTDRGEEIVSQRLAKIREELKDFVERDGTVLAVCGGFYMMGNGYKTVNKTICGLDILDINIDDSNGKKRMIGNVVVECDGMASKVVGFENHSALIDIGNYKPFGKIIKGKGNNGESGFEGLRYKNLIGTSLHGPLLPKNPELCDKILYSALKRKYPDFQELLPLDDEMERLASEYIAER